LRFMDAHAGPFGQSIQKFFFLVQFD
jgi:hypothetical protein